MLLIGLAALAFSIAAVAVLAGRERSSLLKFLRRAVKAAPANAEELDLSFRTVAQAVPAIIWTARPDGSVDFMGQQLYSYTGFIQDQGLGWGWEKALHPDDLPACVQRWDHCVRTGQVYEMEYRIRRADGVYRWFIGRANPLRDDEGRIIQWVGTCTDIEEQKHNQQLLEEQIKERTEELADANARLQQEMQERDSTRQELDRQNEKMMQDLTARSQRATLLTKMGETLQSCISKDEVFAAALGFAPKIFPSRGAVALLNADRNLLEVAGSWRGEYPITRSAPRSVHQRSPDRFVQSPLSCRNDGARNPSRCPRRAVFRCPDARSRSLQEIQRHLRPRRRRHRAARGRIFSHPQHSRRRCCLSVRRRGICRDPSDRRPERPIPAPSGSVPRCGSWLCCIKGNRWGWSRSRSEWLRFPCMAPPPRR